MSIVVTKVDNGYTVVCHDLRNRINKVFPDFDSMVKALELEFCEMFRKEKGEKV